MVDWVDVKMRAHSSMSKLLAVLILAVFIVDVDSQACPQTGRYQFYPSVTNSSSFVRCMAGASRNYTCPQGLVFKPRTSATDNSPLCVPSNSEYGRAAFVCGSNITGNGSYTADPSLYATCQNGSPVAVQECPLGEYFIESTQRCDVTCAMRYKIGSFALANNAYYTCTFNYGTLRWNLTRHTCALGETFDESLQFCLPQVM